MTLLEKPPFRASWILIGSRVVNPVPFKLWMRMHPLDHGEKGCHASAELLASLIGSQADVVSAARLELERYGLLERIPGGRYPAWHVRFPADCIPDQERPSFEVQKALRDRLDLILAERRHSGKSPESPRQIPGVDPPPHTGKSPESIGQIIGSIAGGASRGEGVGDGDSRSPKGLKDPQLLLSAVTLSGVDGGLKEKTAVDAQQETGREDSQSGPGFDEFRRAAQQLRPPRSKAAGESA